MNSKNVPYQCFNLSGISKRGPLTFVLLLAALAISSAAYANSSFQARFEERLSRSLEKRKEPAGLVALLSAELEMESASDPVPFRETLSKLISAPDTQEELRAHALNMMSFQMAQTGRWEDADGLAGKLGFVREWLVIGPFPDDSKAGFDEEYPPEKGLDFKVACEGKGHPVSWRRLPEFRGREVVPMDGMLQPSVSVAGYAVSLIRVAADTPAVLRGGFNEAFKVWVDGELVASKKEYSGRVFDKYSFPCTLRKGWNILMVKLCNQESGWNFSLRLTDAEGKALQGWECSSDTSRLGDRVAEVLKKDGSAGAGASFYDPEALLAEAVEKGGAAEDLSDLAEYLFAKQTFDRGELKDVRAIEAALEKNPASTYLWCLLGNAQEDHNLSRRAFEKALEVDPKCARALYLMSVYYSKRGMLLPSLDYINRAIGVEPDNPVLLAFRAQLRLRSAADAFAWKEIDALLGRFPGCEPVQEAAIMGARGLGLDDRLGALISGRRVSHQADSGEWGAEVEYLKGRGETEKASKLAAECRARFPFLLFAIERDASYQLGMNAPQEARKILEGALIWSPDWSEGRLLLGDALHAMGMDKEGLDEYQKSLLLKPQQEDLKSKVAFLSPEKRGFEEECRIERVDLPGVGTKFASDPAVILTENVAIEVQPSGLSSSYFQKVLQVTKKSALAEAQSFPITFDPDSEEVKVIAAYILKPDGRRVHAESFTTDRLQQPLYRMYFRTRNLVLSFPSLEVGDTLWIEYKVSDIGERNEYGSYFGHIEIFSGPAPILMKQVTLIFPDAMQVKIHQERLEGEPIVMSRGGKKIYRWTERDIPKIQSEPHMPGLTEVAPYLHVSTFDDWETMGRWYAGFIRDQWELTPEIKKLVAELVAGKVEEREKVSAIHRWVVQQTRYVGLEFGVHGYRPYKVRQIFERRFGDCKDKAILLTAMLQEASVEACMVLIRTRNNGEIAEKPASLAIFNHAICYVPSLDTFLDGTAEYSGMTELPYQDQGVWTLLVWRDGKTRRMKTPVDHFDDNRFSASYKISLEKTSLDASFEGKITFKGVECGWVRQRYQDPDKHSEILEQDLSGTFPGTKVSSATFSDLRDLNRDVEVSFKGRFGSLASPDGEGKISVPIWLGRLDLSAQLASLARRVYPLENDYQWTQVYQVTYSVPAGADVEPISPARFEGQFGSVERTVEKRGGEISVVVRVILTADRISTEEYPRFREFCSQAETVASQRLRINLKGGR